MMDKKVEYPYEIKFHIGTIGEDERVVVYYKLTLHWHGGSSLETSHDNENWKGWITKDISPDWVFRDPVGIAQTAVLVALADFGVDLNMHEPKDTLKAGEARTVTSLELARVLWLREYAPPALTDIIDTATKSRLYSACKLETVSNRVLAETESIEDLGYREIGWGRVSYYINDRGELAVVDADERVYFVGLMDVELYARAREALAT